jgi:predicted O-methyltransferase YrrM
MRVAKALRLTKLLLLAMRHLPTGLSNWIEEQQYRLRLRAGHPVSLVPEKNLLAKYREALLLLTERRGASKLGDYLEFGVYAGASLRCMHLALADLRLDHVRLFGFDSFEGLPKAAKAEPAWSPGMYKSDIELTEENLKLSGVDLNRITLVKGWFDETLTESERRRQGIRKASLIMIDCDLYSSARTALRFCAPLILDEAVIFFDDWWPATLGAQNLGEKRAFDEFLQENPHLTATELDSYYSDAAKVFLVSRRDVAATSQGA